MKVAFTFHQLRLAADIAIEHIFDLLNRYIMIIIGFQHFMHVCHECHWHFDKCFISYTSTGVMNLFPLRDIT